MADAGHGLGGGGGRLPESAGAQPEQRVCAAGLWGHACASALDSRRRHVTSTRRARWIRCVSWPTRWLPGFAICPAMSTRAIERCQHALESIPRVRPRQAFAWCGVFQGGGVRDEARATLETTATADNDDPIRLAWLAHLAGAGGARTEARELIAQAKSVQPRRYVSPFHLAIGYVGLEDHRCAFAALEQAWRERDPALATVDGGAATRSAARRSPVSRRAWLARISVHSPRSTVFSHDRDRRFRANRLRTDGPRLRTEDRGP